MKTYSLNGQWHMEGGGYSCEGTVPGSVYSFLMGKDLMPDPYYRDNELEATKILENDFTFSKVFDFRMPDAKVLLRCEGLDTLCDLYLNGKHVAYTDNMHRVYEFDVRDVLKAGENEIVAAVSSFLGILVCGLEKCGFGKKENFADAECFGPAPAK